MKVDLTGFAWTVGNGVSLAELFDHLKTVAGTAVSFLGATRLLYLGEKGAYHTGLFLTMRDEKKVCEIQKAPKGEFKVTVRQLAAGKNIVDFNFFLVHKRTGKGIYQYYYRSAGLTQFWLFCRRYYEDLRSAGRSQELSEAGGRWRQPGRKEPDQEKVQRQPGIYQVGAARTA